MRFLAVLAATLGFTSALKWTDVANSDDLSIVYKYHDFVKEFGHHAPTHSQSAFEANLQTIRSHNADPSSTYTMGVNKFTGMTKKQFKNFIGRGYASSLSSKRSSGLQIPGATVADLSDNVPASQLPASIDWRNVTTAVKDQGQCGGCWSFSVSETIESHVALETGKLITLSEQEILACTPNKQHCGGTGGCEGATQELGFGYAVTAGVTTEAAWPYEATDSACNWKGKKAVVGITGYVALPANDYTALINAVSKQPIAISAAAEAWQFYSSGVLKDNCGTDVDHAIQLVGYGTDAKSGDYWLVRNSWGPSWGEDGYIRIARFGEGKEPCANDSTPGDGDGCSGGPSSISVCGTCGILSDSSYPTGGHLMQ